MPAAGGGGPRAVAQAASSKRQDERKRARTWRIMGRSLFASDRFGNGGKAVAPHQRFSPRTILRAIPGPIDHGAVELDQAGPGADPRPGVFGRWRSRRPRSAASRRRSPCGNRAAAAGRRSRSGAPDSPPASPAWRDRSGGREIVVLETISAPSRLVDARSGRSRRYRRLKIGRDLQEHRRAVRSPRAASTASSSAASAPSSCSARRPGVLGLLTLTAR